MAALSQAQLAALVKAHFPAGSVPQTGESIQVTAYAVARAESGGRPEAVGDGGTSFGIWQINRPSHPQYSASWLANPDNNAAAALAVSGGGRNWNPWCTWERTACGGVGNGRYRGYVPEARAALALPIPPVNPPITPSEPPGLPWAWAALAAAGVALLFYARRR
jgi:hypothetical protein